MIDFEKEITVKWNNNNKKYYESLGYLYTGIGTELSIKLKDLPKGSKTKIPVICDVCEEGFEQSYNSYNILKEKHNEDICKKCSAHIAAAKRIKNNQNNLIQKLTKIADSKNYKLILEDKMYKRKDDIFYECPKHGLQKSQIGNFLSGHGCYDCGRIMANNKTRKEIDEVIKVISSYNNNTLLNPEDYINANENNLKILCGLCGEHVFTMAYGNYKQSTHRCQYCCSKMSQGELFIRNVLDSNNIDYETEKSFPRCKDKKLLNFDFYLEQYNLCIEFDGEQHYNSHFYETMFNDKQKGMDAFRESQKRDEIKNRFCKENKINLLRIPYWKIESVDKIILDEIKKFE